MPAINSSAMNMIELSNTVSDLLVGLNSSDGPEVIFQGSVLKKQADQWDVSGLRETALKIEQAASAGDLEAARLLVPELQHNLQQALILMQAGKRGS